MVYLYPHPSSSPLTVPLHGIGPLMCARYGKGRITESFTVTSGTFAVRPIPGLSNIVGGAGALVSATRGLALDLAPVRANCIAPGLVLTEMWEVRALPLLSVCGG